MNLRAKLKKNRFILFLYNNAFLFFTQIQHNFIGSIIHFLSVYADYVRYKRMGANSAFKTNWLNMQPYYQDKTTITPIDPVYFYQDTWCASKIFQNRPMRHVDVGSSAKTVGIISQFTPTIMVDIRPLELTLEGLNFIEGTILDLPFDDNSIESLSSICVVEHIGLGRYGDPIDPFGSEKAIRELKRVLKPGGYHVYIGSG
jgi:SAM-dependent methyltransferase